jgi:phosphatidylinositol glycan class M
MIAWFACSWSSLLFLGLLVRLALVCWAFVQDSYFRVRYTDIDYLVFSDAAALVFQGKSPYDRPTYRYTPFLAYLFVPNEWFGPLFGKLALVAIDLITAHVLLLCCQALGYSDRKWRVSVAYLFNPLIINITTRGNSEAITICLLAASVLGLLRINARGWFWTSAVCLGIASHVRLFPVVNGVPIGLFLLAKHRRLMPVVQYGIVSMVSLAACSILAYVACGDDYLNNALLYHASRVDHRHSLSLAFPSLYLSPSSGPYLILPQLLMSFVPTALTFFTASLSPEHKLVRSIALQTAVGEKKL